MTPSLLFGIASPFAMVGWLILIASIVFKKPFWRDVIAGQAWPLGLSFLYAVLIVFFWAKAPGGFDTLENVQALFTYQWAALAGWVHYLAFDLFVGAYIAKRVMEEGLPRLILVPLLPLTLMFGPFGLASFYVSRLLFRRMTVQS
jgi:Domain of unknown function (DUF4281)